MSIKFYETVFCKRLFDHQIPKIIKELGRIADALEKANELKEKSDDENRN